MSSNKGKPIKTSSGVFNNKNLIAAQLRGEDVRDKCEWQINKVKPKPSSSKGK